MPTPMERPHGSVILVRHGETECNKAGQCQGWLDSPLTEAGRAQAEEVASLLKGHPVHRIVTSPLQRARHTAEAIARHHRLDVETHDDLKELHHGSLEGVLFRELDHHVPGITRLWREAPHKIQMPQGETLYDLRDRAYRAFDALSQEYLQVQRNGGPYGHLVLVAHALTIGTIVCTLKGEDLHTLRDYRLQPCGYWEVHHDGTDWNVVQCHRRMPPDD